MSTTAGARTLKPNLRFSATVVGPMQAGRVPSLTLLYVREQYKSRRSNTLRGSSRSSRCIWQLFTSAYAPGLRGDYAAPVFPVSYGLRPTAMPPLGASYLGPGITPRGPASRYSVQTSRIWSVITKNWNRSGGSDATPRLSLSAQFVYAVLPREELSRNRNFSEKNSMGGGWRKVSL